MADKKEKVAKAVVVKKEKSPTMPKAILLREPEIVRDDGGKILTITGKCTEMVDGKLCDNTRTIAAQDAFQVRRCETCQKKHLHRKIADKRKARRKAAKAGLQVVKAKTPKAPKAKKVSKKATETPAAPEVAPATAVQA